MVIFLEITRDIKKTAWLGKLGDQGTGRLCPRIGIFTLRQWSGSSRKVMGEWSWENDLRSFFLPLVIFLNNFWLLNMAFDIVDLSIKHGNFP